MYFVSKILPGAYKMIKPICDKCKKELEEFGGILLSPPNESGKVKKLHLCNGCYESIESSFTSEE